MQPSPLINGRRNCHLHLTGSLSPKVIVNIARRLGLKLDSSEPLEAKLDFDAPDIWAAAKEITSIQLGLQLAIESVIDKQVSEKINYVELTLNPHGMLRRGISVNQIVETIAGSVDYAERRNVELKFKYGINRKDGPSSIDCVVQVFQATPAKYRHSIDLNGDERQYPTSDFLAKLRSLSNSGLPISIHAGEFQDLGHSLLEAISVNPIRISHAVALKDHRVAREMANRGITVEILPCSNLKRGAISSLEEYPLKLLLDNNVDFVLGTDDPAFFGNTFDDELKALHQMRSRE